MVSVYSIFASRTLVSFFLARLTARSKWVGQGRSALCIPRFMTYTIYHTTTLTLAKTTIFYEPFSFFIFFSARAYALAEVDGARAFRPWESSFMKSKLYLYRFDSKANNHLLFKYLKLRSVLPIFAITSSSFLYMHGTTYFPLASTAPNK